MAKPVDGASTLSSQFQSRLEKRKQASTFRTLRASDPGLVDFSSNDFLSLSTSPVLRRRFLDELSSGDPATHLGSGGSRLLDGHSTYSEALEKDIASFHHSPDGLLCNSGYDANVAIFTTIPQPGDIIIHDELIHASVHDGMRMSRAAKRLAFAHNSATDLRSKLERCISEDSSVRQGLKNIFIAVESVYSMDGDIVPLSEIVDAVNTLLPKRNGYIIVDEAHSTGIIGSQGRGLVCELGLESCMFIRLHTFGKALACGGGKL